MVKWCQTTGLNGVKMLEDIAHDHADRWGFPRLPRARFEYDLAAAQFKTVRTVLEAQKLKPGTLVPISREVLIVTKDDDLTQFLNQHGPRFVNSCRSAQHDQHNTSSDLTHTFPILERGPRDRVAVFTIIKKISRAEPSRDPITQRPRPCAHPAGCSRSVPESPPFDPEPRAIVANPPCSRLRREPNGFHRSLLCSTRAVRFCRRAH